jgi:ABC-2 type transport system ATP-binding protein
MGKTIILEHVTKKFRGQTVVNDVSLTLSGGTVYGFRGINGSGKTMLLRLIGGLIYPTSGEIWMDEKRLGKDMDFPDSIGVLIEHPAFLDTYSGLDNLKMLASIRNQTSEEELREVLHRVGLNPDDKKKYKKYSLGMKQRLGIAGAIMEQPDIILLDEPANALDTKGIELLREIIRAERERGALLVITCHDAGLLEEMADKIFLLENGRILEG